MVPPQQILVLQIGLVFTAIVMVTSAVFHYTIIMDIYQVYRLYAYMYGCIHIVALVTINDAHYELLLLLLLSIHNMSLLLLSLYRYI